eukprot:4617102-Karenia_brevis.AAC.1
MLSKSSDCAKSKSGIRYMPSLGHVHQVSILAQVALARRAPEQIQAMFDQLRLGCTVRCIKEATYCTVGKTYE